MTEIEEKYNKLKSKADVLKDQMKALESKLETLTKDSTLVKSKPMIGRHTLDQEPDEHGLIIHHTGTCQVKKADVLSGKVGWNY